MSSRDDSIANFDDLLLKRGSLSRVTHALERKDKGEGLTLDELSWFTGLAPITVRNKGIHKLMHFQLVEKIPTEDKKKPKFRLKHNLSINHDASDRRR